MYRGCIRVARKSAGIPVEQLAEMLNVSKATIYRYENGDIEKLPVSIAMQLQSILHLNFNSLITGKDQYEMNFNFEETAKAIVRAYTIKHLDKSDEVPNFTVFIVWSCKTLQNRKALLSTTLFDGMYYELTYNGDKGELYLDAYKKFENVCIKDEEIRSYTE